MEYFYQNVEELGSSFELLSRVCNQVMTSEKLQLVLEAVLVVGNIMNEGTRTGGAAGFKFDSLLKLTQTKSMDGKMTVLDYIVMTFIAKNERSVLELSSDFPDCHTASRIVITDIVSDAATLRKGLKDCRTEAMKMKKDQAAKVITGTLTKNDGNTMEELDPRKAVMASIMSTKNVDDKECKRQDDEKKVTLFHPDEKYSPGLRRLESFIKYTNEEMKKVEEMRDGTIQTCRDLAIYCGESGGERAATNLLGVLVEFLLSLKAAIEKHDKLKERDAKKEAARRKKEQEQEEVHNNTS